ncbi:G2/M phase-specific E3 ubiquitin-protein ligase-like [Ptychodera flava]|uniref:G2/M phase-specific E3 ubiquitin-protein ligase-like n=1 Tax=Ptychodera flava TaxID=63121 RepID=UPI00396A4DB3
MPSSGYSVPYLRDESNLRQALAYIRPLQKNLDKDTGPMKDSETVVKVPCVYCAQEVAVTEVTNHHKSCVEKSEDKNDHSSSEDDLSDELDTNSILPDLKLDGKVNNLLDILGESIPRGDILKALKECNGDADKAFFELTGEKDHDDNDPVIVDDSLPSTSATSIVLSAKEEELEDLGKSMIDVLAFSGASHYDVNINNRGILVYEVMLHHVLLSRKIQLDQLRRGLNSMGLLKAVQNDDKLATVLFPDEGQICFDLLKPKVMLKEDESMETEAKKRAFDFFLTYLEEKCNTQGGETTIYDVLQFVTGYRDVPHKISIKFSPTEAQKLPDPGTCTEELILPIGHGNYSEFMKSFDVTISCQGTGFGRY